MWSVVISVELAVGIVLYMRSSHCVHEKLSSRYCAFYNFKLCRPSPVKANFLNLISNFASPHL